MPTSDEVVVLTFDVGADAVGLPKILRILAGEHVPVTFFLTGALARANSAGVAQIVEAGHRVGNHTMTHPHMTDRLAQADDVVAALDHLGMRFRPNLRSCQPIAH